MNSFSLLRTNVGLTTNIKVVCDSNYNLYLESIDSAPDLSINKFKKVQFNKNNYYDELVPYFFKDYPADIAYQIKYSNDADNMSVDFSTQYDDIYQKGARNIVDNKNYLEEYEYFAPLYIFKNLIPKYFIVFRVDGPGLSVLEKDNFRQEFLNRFKAVKLFDLTKNTPIGEWIQKNFRDNISFPNSCLEIDFRNLEFSRWIGIDYETGGYTYKSKFLEGSLEIENTLFDFEKLFFDGFKVNKVIHPQLVNFSYLFDDTPATPNSLRKWSINRYSGFYLDDMDLVDCLNPYSLPMLKDDVQILEGNELFSPTGDPFTLGFKDNVDMWVEYNGEFHKVEKYTETTDNVLSTNQFKNQVINTVDNSKNKTDISQNFKQETVLTEQYTSVSTIKYKIISEIDLEGKELQLNQKTFYIDTDNYIKNLDNTSYEISNFEDADVYLIQIGDMFHNLIIENGFLKIHSDYAFEKLDNYRLEYYINGKSSNFYKFIDLNITNQNPPKCIKVFRLKFTDIKDFDTQIIDNQLSKFEYEKYDDITITEEPKMYTTDLRSSSNPATFNDYIYKDEVIQIPSASDYTANLETFRITDGNLTDLWRKNPIHCRFAFQSSLSAGDYPYLLNNNEVHENFNRTVDTFQIIPDRKTRNLDYFYTINSGTTSYVHHSLHIEKNYNDTQDSSFRFELDKYLNLYTYSVGTISTTYSSDYFRYLFSSTQSFFNGRVIKNVKKYSQFEVGDRSIPNITLFRGLKFKIFEVDSIVKSDIQIDDINLFTSNIFDDYKFSILLSQNTQSINNNGEIQDSIDWGNFIGMQSESGNLAIKTSDITSPSNITVGDIVEIKQSYPVEDIKYNGISKVTSVGVLSGGGYGFVVNKTYTSATSSVTGYFKINFQWKVIKNWELDITYSANDLVFYDDVLYRVISSNTITDPNQDPSNLPDLYEYSVLKQPFWNPEGNYSINDWCFRQGEFYVRNSTPAATGIDFWKKKQVAYKKNEVILWKGRYYKNLDMNNISVRPIKKGRKSDISNDFEKYWKEVPSPRDWFAYDEEFSDVNTDDLWDKISIWNDSEYYSVDQYIVHEETLYQAQNDTEISEEPGNSDSWLRVYSFIPDTNFVYSPSNNPIIKIGESFFLCEFNSGATLDSGITIYINKKWKNILVNIAINDNTSKNIDNCERDLMYDDINSRLTAANFVRQINDLDSKYDFSDYTSYVVIEEDGSIKKYNFENKIEDLPLYIICEEPDEFEVRNNSLQYSINTLSNNELKPKRVLKNGKIENLRFLNYYNEIPLGCEIDRNENEFNFGKNYNGRDKIVISNNATIKPKSANSNISETFYRHSGNYMPLFYDIELFKSSSEFSTIYGNYKFDESLTFFGIMKHRVISKVNRKFNILKLRDKDNLKSIYPMVDEYGYTVSDFFIFKSSWDYLYHIECSIPQVNKTVTKETSIIRSLTRRLR